MRGKSPYVFSRNHKRCRTSLPHARMPRHARCCVAPAVLGKDRCGSLDGIRVFAVGRLLPKRPYVGETELDGREDLEDWKGLISADRNDKATLPLTIPRPIRVVCGRSKPQKLPSWNPAITPRIHPSRGSIAALGTRATAETVALLAARLQLRGIGVVAV